MPRSRPMSTPTHPRALALIEQLALRLAFGSVKSMPHPHEYTGRDKTDPAREMAYVLLFRLIQADGVFERWRAQQRRYLYPGDGNKYWAMTDSRRAGCSTGCESRTTSSGCAGKARSSYDPSDPRARVGLADR